MNLKGLNVKCKSKNYTLKNQLSQGGFSHIYEVNDSRVICKVQVLSNPKTARSYGMEKQMLLKLKHPNIITLEDHAEIQIKDCKIGLLFLENCTCGTAHTSVEQGQEISQKQVLSILLAACSALEYLHLNNIAHRDVKLQNILKNQNNQYKLCDFGSACTKIIKHVDSSSRTDIEEQIQRNTTPLYRSPQQLDLYSKFQIGPKVDIFALGIMGFILCFKKPPFETRLSAINNQYFLPLQTSYSQQLIQFIKKCFTTNPQGRPCAKNLKQQLILMLSKKKAQIEINIEKELYCTKDELQKIKQLKKSTQIAQSSFLDTLKKFYNQITTETEGWIAAYVQDNQQAPILKYNRSIIAKCYEKKYKISKVYSIFWRYIQECGTKSLIVLKLLLLLHNFIRKGPIQAVIDDSQYSPIRLLTKIYKIWKSIRTVDEEDFKRNVFTCLLIRNYSLVLLVKSKLCYQNSTLIEGNYSIMPYLSGKYSQNILTLKFIQELLNMLEISTQFHHTVQRISYLTDIQRSIILSMVDEQYCLVSTFVFVLATFKRAVAYASEEIDLKKLKLRIQFIESRFQHSFNLLRKLIQQTEKFASLFDGMHFSLHSDTIQYIRKIQLLNLKQQSFEVKKYLNYKENICGLKIPLPYEDVVKNPNFLQSLQNIKHDKNYAQVKDFQIKKNNDIFNKNHHNNRNQDVSGNKSNNKFENFIFTPQKNYNNKNYDTIEFTHQNLNKDFNNNKEQNSKQFNDFLSIVESKYQKQKTIKQIAPKIFQVLKKQNPILQTSSFPNQSIVTKYQIPRKNSFLLQSKPSNIELVNFFDDDIVVQERKKSQYLKQSFQQVKEIQYFSQKQEFQKNLKQKHSDLFMDLKDFILQQVKKSAQQYIIDYSMLNIQKKIGEGNCSQVFKGEWRGRSIAIKKVKIEINSPTQSKQFRRQIMTSVKIRNHPHLVTLIGVSQHLNHSYIINEYCNGSTMFDLLHESNAPLEWKTRIMLARQIVQGMQFLHTNDPPIMHRDLKSLNVLLVNNYDSLKPELTQVKIADFGLSRDYEANYMTGALGTYMQHWMAPEIFNNQAYTLKADVYSFAIVLWQIASRVPPYTNLKNPQSLMKFITLEDGRPDLKLIHVGCPPKIKDLISRCWDKIPQNRPDFGQILMLIDSIQ